jgi:hypothetical protein
MLGESLSLVTTEAQWSFVDGYADMMIARGPTLNPDRSAATGLMHLVDLPDLDAARVFAFDEPNYRASVYGDVLIRRRRNTFGCTMWDFRPARPDHLRDADRVTRAGCRRGDGRVRGRTGVRAGTQGGDPRLTVRRAAVGARLGSWRSPANVTIHCGRTVQETVHDLLPVVRSGLDEGRHVCP